jgi:hypothetical protein
MKTLTTILVLIVALSSFAVAADKPNFSGDWKINIDKSNFGPAPPPSSLTRKIVHTDPALTIDEAQSGPQGDMQRAIKYTTDGKECTNEFMGQPVKSTLAWDGKKLVITSKADFGGTEVKLIDTWSLSDDGKETTDVLHIVSPQGEFDITYVLNKT